MKCILVASISQVSYISQDCEEIPEFLGRKYGHMAKRLDLSFNLLRYVAVYRFLKCNVEFQLLKYTVFCFGFFFFSKYKDVCRVHLIVIKWTTLFYR